MKSKGVPKRLFDWLSNLIHLNNLEGDVLNNKEYVVNRALEHIGAIKQTDVEFQAYPLISKFKKNFGENLCFTKEINLVGFTNEYSPRLVEYFSKQSVKGRISKILKAHSLKYDESSQLNMHILNKLISLDSVALINGLNGAEASFLSLEQISFQEGVFFNSSEFADEKTRYRVELKEGLHLSVIEKMLDVYLEKIEEYRECYLLGHFLQENIPRFNKGGELNKYFSVRSKPDYDWCGYNIVVQSSKLGEVVESLLVERGFKNARYNI